MLIAFAAAGCASDGVGPTFAPDIEVAIEALPELAPADGSYELWVVNTEGTIRSAGRFTALSGQVRVRSPLDEPTHLLLTIEPVDDTDDAPSPLKLAGGRFGSAGTAVLDVTGYLTPVGIPLEATPGVHVLGTASRAGSPDAGLWLIDARVDSSNASFYQTFSPLTTGWIYEGWIVRDRGTATEVWLSYGQFLPNSIRKARFRDDTGIGPFSGYTDYEQALLAEVHYPGDDWLANPHGYPVPGNLSLPLDLNGDIMTGEPSPWTHVITIEPRHQDDGSRTESPWDARPFFLRPYRNAIGEADAEQARTIGFAPETLPRGTARILMTRG